MTSLLAGTLDHGVSGSRGVRESHCSRLSPVLSGTPGTLRNSQVAALTTTLMQEHEPTWLHGERPKLTLSLLQLLCLYGIPVHYFKYKF